MKTWSGTSINFLGEMVNCPLCFNLWTSMTSSGSSGSCAPVSLRPPEGFRVFPAPKPRELWSWLAWEPTILERRYFNSSTDPLWRISTRIPFNGFPSKVNCFNAGRSVNWSGTLKPKKNSKNWNWDLINLGAFTSQYRCYPSITDPRVPNLPEKYPTRWFYSYGGQLVESQFQ